ncbi:MAG: threonine--tRNA ligase, partial [Bartonella sp.]|nr:threonine--tRNA ligase [Bartonella sp.]
MFKTIPAADDWNDEYTYALKPMNCPGHVQIFKHGLKSYRDLPIRLAEFGLVHRYEPSGSLHGLMRVRSFTQDDAHIFCTEEQLADECLSINDLILSTYADFGFKKISLKLSTRP